MADIKTKDMRPKTVKNVIIKQYFDWKNNTIIISI
jgi:hypothetical protein